MLKNKLFWEDPARWLLLHLGHIDIFTEAATKRSILKNKRSVNLDKIFVGVLFSMKLIGSLQLY